MKQPFLLVLALAATHGESEDAVSREPCPDTCTCSPGISCLFWTTIHFRPDCIAECFSQTPCSVIKKETFLPDSRYILPDRRRGYTCGDGSTKTKIFYPKPIGPPPTAGFPVVMFHRGSSGYYSEHDVSGLGYDAWLESVAKQCLIVIAPQTDGVPWIPSEETSDACKTDKDLLIAMKWAKANLTKLPLPYPSFKADWGSVGAMGHSAGAHHLPRSLKTLRTRTVSTSRLRSSLTAATTCTSTYPTTPWAYTTIHGHVNRPSSLPRMAITDLKQRRARTAQPRNARTPCTRVCMRPTKSLQTWKKETITSHTTQSSTSLQRGPANFSHAICTRHGRGRRRRHVLAFTIIDMTRSGAANSHLWAVTGVAPSLSELDPGRAWGHAGPVCSSSAN